MKVSIKMYKMAVIHTSWQQIAPSPKFRELQLLLKEERHIHIQSNIWNCKEIVLIGTSRWPF